MKIVAVSGTDNPTMHPVTWIVWGLVLGTTAAIFMGTLSRPNGRR